MALIKAGSKEVTAIDGGSMEKAADVGVEFGCHNGVCGRCSTTVISGMENLSALSEAEDDMSLDSNKRLMCQCTISGGTVELEVG